MLDLGADGYDAKELAINAVANAQVSHRRLKYLHAQNLGILRKQDGTGITFERAVSDCNVCTAITSQYSVIGARTLVHIKDSRKLDAAAWEVKVCGYSEESNPNKSKTLKIRRVVESRNVTFIETPLHLLPPPLQLLE